MSSSYKGIDLFGSGPHRFRVMREGLFVVPLSALGDVPEPGSAPLGELELEVQVTGRLVADDDDGLWALRDAITALIEFPPTPGTLEDLHGREWTDMSFISFETGEVTDRGREVSVGYTAVFRRFLSS